jgi:AbrB family looped-hinge helix DNA binding protein
MDVKVRAVVTSKGQITIPKPVRDALGIGESDQVEFEVRGKRATMKPVERNFFRWYGSVKARNRPENFKKIREETAREVGRRVARGTRGE